MAPTSKDPSDARPELIVVAHPEAELRLHGRQVRSAAVEAGPLEHALHETGASARPLFGPSEERIQARRDESPWDLPDLSVYYRVGVDADGDRDGEAVAARLNEEESIAGAFLKAPAAVDEELLAVAADAALAPLAAVTPDFSDRQRHLDPPLGGVNARAAWTKPGGKGDGIQMVIVGGAWRPEHEDLAGHVGGRIGGMEIDAVSFRNHGTAVLGTVRANLSDRGVTGVAPSCTVRVVATFGLGTAAAIKLAADALPAGGVILIEWQRPGPGSTGVGSAGFLPLEWWPDDFAAIQYATRKGVIVVEPAGNGSVSLDDPFYNTPAPGFPASWKNPFDRVVADCGAIMVGAGAPPPTQGQDHGPDRSRLAFSNSGTSLDAQGWGAELVTLAYGDLQGGPDENIWYTAKFGGTSGAAAVVAGVVASIQGMELAGPKRPPLTPADVRRMLRQTGSPQEDGPGGTVQAHRIGSRPDLMALIALLSVSKDEAKDAKDAKTEKNEAKDAKNESKDAKDAKTEKAEKDEGKERKDAKDEGKEFKDSKNEDKENKGEKREDKDVRDKGPQPSEVPPFAPEGLHPPLPAWLRSDEAVRHFIPDDLRPRLSAAALTQEPDLQGRSAAELDDELRPPTDPTVGP